MIADSGREALREIERLVDSYVSEADTRVDLRARVAALETGAVSGRGGSEGQRLYLALVKALADHLALWPVVQHLLPGVAALVGLAE